MIAKFFSFVRRNPVPLLAFLGIAFGTIARFAFHLPAVGDLIWQWTLIIGGLPIVFQTIWGMVKGKFASDIVASLAIITAFLTGQVFAGAVVVLMQSGGEAIESYGLRRASFSLTELLKRAPRIARRKRGELIEEIEVDSVALGDLLIVKSGELIPVDGTIIHGGGEIDESSLTGEPIPQVKGVNDPLFSGTMNRDGAITMVATKISQESHYAKIVRMVKRAQEEKAPIQRLADKYAIFFTPLTIFIAVIAFLLTHSVTTVLSVLVVATPCPLILATPLAVICAINRAAELGIIVKGGAPIEQIASTKIALFDKTGTITFGLPSVEKIVPLENETIEDLLYKVAGIEQLSSHLIAKAIVKEGLQKFKTLPLPSRFEEVAGLGVEADFEGATYRIGSSKWVGYKQENEGECPQVYVAKEGKCIGFFVLGDEVRKEAFSVMEKLKTLKVEKIAILTGDARKNAEAIARQVGIEEVEAELSPEDKVKKVKHYRTISPFVLMVGDGINDAPALASATVGMAMGAHGTAISAESADIVLLVDDLSKVCDTIAIGQRMLKIAKQSIGIGMGLSLFLMLIAMTGIIAPPVGALLQEVIDVAVILNALRAR